MKALVRPFCSFSDEWSLRAPLVYTALYGSSDSTNSKMDKIIFLPHSHRSCSKIILTTLSMYGKQGIDGFWLHQPQLLSSTKAPPLFTIIVFCSCRSPPWQLLSDVFSWKKTKRNKCSQAIRNQESDLLAPAVKEERRPAAWTGNMSPNVEPNFMVLSPNLLPTYGHWWETH